MLHGRRSLSRAVASPTVGPLLLRDQGQPQQSPQSFPVKQGCPPLSLPTDQGRDCSAPGAAGDPILDKDSQMLWRSKGQRGIFRAVSAPAFSVAPLFPESLPFHRCTDTEAVSPTGLLHLCPRHGLPEVPVWERAFPVPCHSSSMPCWDPAQLPSCAVWVRVSCRNHSTHGEGDWWLKCNKQDMDGDKHHLPTFSFPPLSPLV